TLPAGLPAAAGRLLDPPRHPLPPLLPRRALPAGGRADHRLVGGVEVDARRGRAAQLPADHDRDHRPAGLLAVRPRPGHLDRHRRHRLARLRHLPADLPGRAVDHARRPAGGRRHRRRRARPHARLHRDPPPARLDRAQLRHRVRRRHAHVRRDLRAHRRRARQRQQEHRLLHLGVGLLLLQVRLLQRDGGRAAGHRARAGHGGPAPGREVTMKVFTPGGRAAVLAVLSAGAVLALAPIVWLVSTSFKERGDVFAVPPQLIPAAPTAANYAYVWNQADVQRYFVNSLIASGGTVLLNVSVAALLGFALARFAFRGRKLLFLLGISTMVVPFPAIMLPLFVATKELGLTDHLLGIILPTAAVNMWLSVYILREAFAGLPRELEEAARIDGCAPARMFWQVMLPLVKAP